MEDLSLDERIRQRVDRATNGDGSETDEGGEEDLDSRVLQRVRDSTGAAVPRTEDVETTFDTQEPLGDGGFDPADVTPEEAAERMKVLGRMQQERNEAPQRIQQNLEEDEDPGIQPGDQSEEEAERERSMAETMIRGAVDMLMATHPGTEQNARMTEAVRQGWQTQLAQLRQSAGAMKLVSAGTIEGPLASVPITSKEAQRLGLEDQLSTPEEKAEAAQQLAQASQRLQEIGTPEAVRRAAEAPGIFSALSEIAEDPEVAIPNLVTSSSLSSVPPLLGAIAGAPAGPVGMFAGQFLGTYGVETRFALANMLAEEGVDISDPVDIMAATADPTMRRRVRNRAKARGLAVATVDGLFGAATAGLSRTGLSPITKSVGGFALETFGEGAGEGAGQVAAGEEIRPGEMAMESVAALGQSGATSIASVTAEQLLPSERRLRTELERQIEEGRVEVDVPESQMAKMLQRAIDNGGLEQPRSAAEQAIQDAIRRGELEVQPTQEPETDEGARPTGEREAEEAGAEEAIGDEVRRQVRAEMENVAAGRRAVESMPEIADPDRARNALESRLQTAEHQLEEEGEIDEAVLHEAALMQAAVDYLNQTESTAQREPATPRQRLEALGLDPAEHSTNREDVADLELQARRLEEMNATELEAAREEVSARLDELQQLPEEREMQQPGDPDRLRAVRQLIDQAITEREAEETGQAETDLDPEAAPEPGEEPQQFQSDVEQAPPDLLQATAENEEIAPEEAQVVRQEVERRRQEDEIDESQAETILQALPAPEETPTETQTEQDTEEAPADRTEDVRTEQEQTAPALSVGEERVDTGGTGVVPVIVQEEPTGPTVEVEARRPDGSTERRRVLVDNLRRPGEVEEEPPGSAFPVADIDNSGRAVLTDEYQVIPEGATVAGNADVRHDLGTSDLPVARRTQEEGVRRRVQAPDDAEIAESIQAAIDEGRIPSFEEHSALSTTIYRGYGRENQGEVYRGPAVPITGPGRYYAFDVEDAERFGPNLEERDLETADNPLVITSDEEWRELTQAAGWEFPNPFGADEETMQENARALQQELEERGHDALMVWWDSEVVGDFSERPNGERAGHKTLRTVFGEPQVLFPNEEPAGAPDAGTSETTETTEQEADLTQMGRRTPIRQEERIQQQVEQTERELEQARKALEDLKAQRPEQQRQQEGQESLFGGPSEAVQRELSRRFGVSGDPESQPAFSEEMEASAETTEQLQDMIDQQRAVVDELQQRLVDLRQQAPDAQSQARQAQQDIDDELDQQERSRQEQTEQPGAPPRSRANVSTESDESLTSRASRDERGQAIQADLTSLVRPELRGNEEVQRTLEDVSRAVDRIRELREVQKRGQTEGTDVEGSVATVRSQIDSDLAEIRAPLSDAEMSALRDRVQQWTETTGDPGAPQQAHLNALTPQRQLGPDYQTDSGYQVRTADDGTLEVISPNTGNAIDRRSSRFDEVVIEYFAENSEVIDESPRVTDRNPDMSFSEWPAAVASGSQNPFEIVEAILVEQQTGAFDPVAMELRAVQASSLEPYIGAQDLVERGAGNWVSSEESAPAIENLAKRISRQWGVDVTPQQIVDEYILEHPGGPSTLDTSPRIEALREQFQSITGLPITAGLANQIHEAAYEQPTQQTRGDRGVDPGEEGAPFEPRVSYVHRSPQRRSSVLRRSGDSYSRRTDGRSLRELAADGYELREGEPESVREDGLDAVSQLSLFGPEGGTTEQEAQDQEGGPFEELGRAIPDDLATEKGASLVGRTVRGPEDLASIAQVLRDPRFETFRFFFVQDQEDGTQQIKQHTGVSMRLPGSTSIFPVELEDTSYLPEHVDPEGLDKWGRLNYWAAHRMDEMGADGYYVMHNHPSGRTRSSRGDRNVTRRLALTAPGFRGHVIIDSGEFAILDVEPERKYGSVDEARADLRRRTGRDPSGVAITEEAATREDRFDTIRKDIERDLSIEERRVEIEDEEVLRRAQIEERPRTATDRATGQVFVTGTRQSDRLQQPSLDHPALMRPVQSDADLVQLMQEVNLDTEAPIVIMTGADRTVRAVFEADGQFLRAAGQNEISRELLRMARETGSTDAFLTNIPDDLIGRTKALARGGVFRDFVTRSGLTRVDYDVTGMLRGRQFGLPEDRIDPIRVEEDQDNYGKDLRDEIRRRVGRLEHNTPEQQEPAADSGPTDSEHIRQAAVRIEGDLYRGATHPEALQAAIDDGAVVREDGNVRMPDGRPLSQADVSLDLYTTSRGRVVARQETGHVIGVERADMIDRQRRPQRRRLEPLPNPVTVARRLNELQTREARVIAPEDLPPNANSVDTTLEGVTDEEEQHIEIRRSLTDETVNADNPVSAADVIGSFIDVVREAGREVPLRYGRYRGFSFSSIGVFKVEPEVIRLKEALDIPTAAHEMGHALEKAVFGWVDGSPWQQAIAGTDGAVQDELVALGKELYGDRTPDGGYKREGWAQFVKFYLLSPERAQSEAPQLFEWFESTFLEEHPRIAQAMEQARQLGRRWYDQGSLKRAQASVQKKRSFWDNFKDLVTTDTGRERLRTEVSQATLTEFSPLLRVVEEAEERLGESLPIDENPFLTAEALQKTHAARTRMFVEQGTFDFAGNKVGPPLRDAAQLVRGQREEFTLYLWARRALKLWEGRPAQFDEEGNQIASEKEPRNPGLSKEDAQYIFDYYDSENFREAAERVYQWNNEVLDYTKAAFDPDMAERIKGGDVGDYIPLQRVFGQLNDSVVDIRQSAQNRRVLGSDPIKSLEGSPRDIRDPFQVMIEQAGDLIRATHERYILNQLIKLGTNVEGMGRFVEQVPRDQVPMSINTERVVEDLRERGLTIDVPAQEIDNRVELYAQERDLSETELRENRRALRQEAREELMDEKLSHFMTFFKPAIVPEGSQDPIVAVQTEDGVKWFEMSRQLYDTFQGLDIYRLPWYLDWAFGVPARMFRLGTTGIRASFALITNPARDLQVLYAQSRSSQNPGTMFMNYLYSMGKGLETTIRDDIEVDPHFERFMRLGGQIARPLGVDTEETRRAVRELFQGRATRVLSPNNWIDHLRDVFQIPESATRVAEMKATAEEIGWEEGTKMSDGQALQLLLDAKRVTTDFTSQGKYTKVANQVIPFVTATIGGQRAFARAWDRVRDGNPRAIAAATTMTAATLAYWWQLKDEEWYQDMIPRQKFNNWFFPVEGGPVLVIPRPFEWGATFSALPEALADAWYQDDPETVRTAMDHMYKNWSPIGTTNVPGVGEIPMGLPVPAQVFAEQLANQSFYFETPIVPRGETRKPAAEQFGPYTSTVAIQIGRAFDVSPRRIDHMIAGFLGGVGRDATQAMDSLLAVLGIEGESPSTQREQTASDIPVVGELFRRGGRPGTQSQAVDDFFELLEQKQMIQASDVKTETQTDRQARLMLQDAQKALSLLFWLRRNTPDTERRRNLMVEIRRVAQDAVGTVNEGLPAILEKRGELGALEDIESMTSELPVEDVRDLTQDQLDAIRELRRREQRQNGESAQAIEPDPATNPSP